jgi:hypothetical protein
MDNICSSDPFQVKGGISMVFTHEKQTKTHALII